MKKRFFILGALILASFTLLLGGNNVTYAKFQDEIVEVAQDNSFVKIGEMDHGTVTVDKISGLAGDICTITIKGDTLYCLDSISVNGNLVNPDESGSYKFVLAEGDNNISAKFIVDRVTIYKIFGAEEGEKIATLMDSAEEVDNWTDFFTADNVFTMVSLTIDIVFGVAFLIMFIKNKKIKSTDRTDIINAVQNSVPEEAKKIISELINNFMTDFFKNIAGDCSDVKNAMQVLVQAMLYNLEGTDESKQQIIKLLSTIKLTDDKTVAEVTKYFEDKFAKLQADYDEKVKLLEEMKKANSEALEKANIKKEENVKEDDSYDGTSI